MSKFDLLVRKYLPHNHQVKHTCVRVVWNVADGGSYTAIHPLVALVGLASSSPGRVSRIALSMGHMQRGVFCCWVEAHVGDCTGRLGNIFLTTWASCAQIVAACFGSYFATYGLVKINGWRSRRKAAKKEKEEKLLPPERTSYVKPGVTSTHGEVCRVAPWHCTFSLM